MNKNITCSVDSVTELLRAIKDYPSVEIKDGQVLFQMDERWVTINYVSSVVNPKTVPEIMLACKAGFIEFVVFDLSYREVTLMVELQEEAEDVDLIEELFEL